MRKTEAHRGKVSKAAEAKFNSHHCTFRAVPEKAKGRGSPLQATTEYIMKDWDGGAVFLWSDKLKTLILQNFSITVRMTLFIAKVDEVSGTLVTRRCLFLITEV